MQHAAPGNRARSGAWADDEIIATLDGEFASVWGWPLSAMRRGGIAVVHGGHRALVFGTTCSRGFVVSAEIGENRLRQAVGHCQPQDLLGPPVCDALMNLMPCRGPGWTFSRDVSFYCSVPGFTPCKHPEAKVIPPDDPFVKEWQMPKRRLEAAFGVRDGETLVAHAILVDQGKAPFLAIGVHTRAGYEGRDFGKACVSAATAHALSRGCIPLYNTQADNHASLAVARALGYAEYFRIVCAS